MRNAQGGVYREKGCACKQTSGANRVPNDLSDTGPVLRPLSEASESYCIARIPRSTPNSWLTGEIWEFDPSRLLLEGRNSRRETGKPLEFATREPSLHEVLLRQMGGCCFGELRGRTTGTHATVCTHDTKCRNDGTCHMHIICT